MYRFRKMLLLTVLWPGVVGLWFSAATAGPADEPQSSALRNRHNRMNHDKLVLSLAFSPDGKTLASGSEDKTIKLWTVATGKERATLKGRSGRVMSVGFTPDGKTLASGSRNSIKLWKMKKGKE
jgi:WD40 repeat protein